MVGRHWGGDRPAVAGAVLVRTQHDRTLVYGLLTLLLALMYFGGIVLLQRVFVSLTGQQSTLAIVASTLLIAALFNP
jgi:hypothetical protein